MATATRTYYTRDRSWRVVLTAWKTSAVFWNSIGATIHAQHLENSGWLFRTRTWVDRPVQSISVAGAFEGILATTVPGVARKSDVRFDAPDADVRYWAVGVGIRIKPEGGAEPAGPGGAADLLIRAVRATGSATINGETLVCEEVFAQ